MTAVFRMFANSGFQKLRGACKILKKIVSGRFGGGLGGPQGSRGGPPRAPKGSQGGSRKPRKIQGLGPVGASCGPLVRTYLGPFAFFDAFSASSSASATYGPTELKT